MKQTSNTSVLMALFITFFVFVVVGASTTEIDMEMCAEAYHPYGHLLANLNKRGQPTVSWFPKGNFYITVGDNYIRLKGSLVTRIPGGNQDKILEMDFTFTDERATDQCFCGSQDFVNYVGTNSVSMPNYNMVQNRCTGKLQRDPYVNPNNLDFCPKCERDQCRRAREAGKAPAPIYRDWRFFNDVSGTLSGDGLPVFREKIHDIFKAVDPSLHSCTPTIKGLPLAQFYCSNMTDPDYGRGFGVNGKNQKCGMAVWLNCEEDIPTLDAGATNGIFSGHVMDINLNFMKCPPTASPTMSPTNWPTHSPTTGKPTMSPTTPEPTVSPTGHPSTEPTVSPSNTPTLSPTAGPSTEKCQLIKQEYEMYQCTFAH
uniref:Uncharacterized protein n=1 Tax=Aplanochytrium stocchinoi TaxID=215587 RepID=A0A6S8CQX2_9STRA|mmetsp:Transcript_35350/g.43637  ORF Transcript_35350/g.43637 Transcript_35350/m.43637 type:complete len:370 (+) Transcript_35350:308-1417(+)